MCKKTKIICLSVFSFIFILCFFLSKILYQTVFVWFVQDASLGMAAIAEIQTKDSLITINAFGADSENYYLFLPSYAKGKLLVVNRDSLFFIGVVESGMSVAIDAEHTLTILTGSEMPSVFLTLKNDFSYISSNQSHSDSGRAVIVDVNGENMYVGSLEKIKGRGNTSWEQEKKPFNITLESAASLTGTGALTSEFSLVTSRDLSFLKNRISNEMAKMMEAPYMEGMHVNLYINDSYEGIYELYQRIKPDYLGVWDLESETELINCNQASIGQYTTGVALDDWNQSITGKWWSYEKNPDNITGGYILEMDYASRYTDEPSGFILDSGAYVVSKSPSHLSEAQYGYISSYIQKCENAMVSSVGKEDAEELLEYIDISSFVAKYLIEEVSKNIEASSTSQYFYKAKDDVLYAGPVWDYDSAYGADGIHEGINYLDPEGFSARDIPGTLVWWQLLYYNNAVYNDIAATYEEVLYPYLSWLTQSELSLWDEELSESAVMDYIRWKRCDSSDLSEIRNCYHAQAAMVSDFLSARKEFLYQEWAEGRE